MQVLGVEQIGNRNRDGGSHVAVTVGGIAIAITVALVTFDRSTPSNIP